MPDVIGQLKIRPVPTKLVLNNSDCRAVGRSENSGVPVLFGGHNLPPPG